MKELGRYSILVVEDSKEQIDMIRAALGDGYDIDSAGNMADAVKLIETNNYDLFLLDIILPDGDGFQICTSLKSQPHTKDTPIIFLTSKKETTDKVIGFSLGAEDYIVKPCPSLELKARIDSKLRKVTKSEVHNFPGLQFNFLSQVVTLEKGGNPPEALDLTPREYKLLSFFVRNRGMVLSREQILKSVWGENMHVSDRSIDTHVAALRKKLGPFASYIKSVHGTGYRFSAEPSSSRHTA